MMKKNRNIVNSKLSWINYSIDGLENEYNKIRTPRNKKNDKSFNAFRVVESIKTLTGLKEIKFTNTTIKD